jgi:hypothetical protein
MWRTITVRDWLCRSAGAEFVQIAEYSRLTLGLPRHGTCEQMPRLCAVA